jgi:RNA polymerase sigma factor (sigma-70 family)
MANSIRVFVQHLRILLDPARHDNSTDGQLLTRWVTHRDTRAFAALMWRHGGLVWRVGLSVLQQREDAEDVFQAAFLVLTRKAAGLQRRSSIAGWLHQTTYRLALKARTAAARRLRREGKAAKIAMVDPLEEISVREARTILAEELHRMPAAYREPLLLCLYEGATQDEAARQLGCSLSTLKRRLECGRALLGERLSRRGFAPESTLALTLYSLSKAPIQLVHHTLQTVDQFAAGETLATNAAGLAESVLRSVLLKKLAFCLTAVLGLGSLTLAGGVFFLPMATSPAAKGPPVAQLPQVKEQPPLAPRLDRYGDPMPSGAINRLGSLHFRHADAVHNVIYTRDGKAIASTSNDGFLQLWDAATGKTRWRLVIEKAMYGSAIAMSPDGEKLALLTNFEYIVVAADTGKVLSRHQWPKADGDDAVRCVAIAPDLTAVARGCWDATVRVYDSTTGQEKLRMHCGDKGQSLPLTIVFSANGKMVHVVASGKPGVMVFDTANGKLVRTLGPEDVFYRQACVIVSADSRWVAAMITRDPITSKGGPPRVVVWDTATGKQLHVLPMVDRIWTGTFSPDGNLLAIGTFSKDVIVFNTATGMEQLRINCYRDWRSLTFNPDCKTLAGGDQMGCITVADVTTGRVLAPTSEPPSQLYLLHFLDGGKALRAFCGNGFYWWNVRTGQAVRHLPQKPEWDRNYRSQSISPDGKQMTAQTFHLDEDGKVTKSDLLLVDVATGNTLRKLTGHSAIIVNAAFSPDGAKVISLGGWDPRAIVWDVATGKQLREFEIPVRYALGMTLSPDGRWLATFTSQVEKSGDRDVWLWEVETGKLAHRLKPPSTVFDAIFTADSSRLILMCNSRPAAEIGTVEMWEVASGKVVRTFVGQDHIGNAAITSDSRMLATAGRDKKIRLFEVATGEERDRIIGHESVVRALDFSPDGKLLAAASCDAPAYVWDVFGLEKPRKSAGRLGDAEGTKLWRQLADPDSAVAFQTICELITRPAEAVPLLANGWKALPRATPKQIERWVQELNSDQFAMRTNATAELERFQTGHEGLLKKAFQEAGSLEVRQRLESILRRLDPQRLRRTRMLEILERIDNAQARQFLQALGDQTEDAELAREAAAGLERVKKL